ncbi:DUF596 domain-containing protein [Xylella fastidiosa]|uniref:DUF596 domain-containing protein n=1 Tax=Xylella fastidiosa TaxID=2371 RepID=UPI00073396C0|nr:DUF596 domain-containing protein [Xylella fastidiosa]
MLTQERIDNFCEDLGGALDGLWSYIEDSYATPPQKPDPATFEERKNDFLFMIGKLLNEGKLKLAEKGEFITGTTEELVEMFRKSFPNSDEEMEFGVWFFSDDCPAGAVWVYKGEGENGEDEYEWT